MKHVIVIRHHDVDSAGFIAAAFEARGAEVAVRLFPDDGPLPASLVHRRASARACASCCSRRPTALAMSDSLP